MGVPGWLLSTTGRNPYSFWKAHPGLWELLPGAPPSLRARPAAAAAAAAHARERTAAAPAVAGGGSRWPPEAERESTATLPVPVAAGEGRPPSAMLAAAQMEVAYIRRLYTMCVTDHPKGIPVRNFTRQVRSHSQHHVAPQCVGKLRSQHCITTGSGFCNLQGLAASARSGQLAS